MKLLLALILLSFMGCSGAYYKGDKSDHFDGERFYNKTNNVTKTLWQVLKWRFSGNRTPWPESVPVNQVKIENERVNNGSAVVTFINHATFLIQVDGLNILTDPVYSQRTSPVSFAGPKRVRKPGVAFEDLPPIDVVIISHDHYDHLDVETLKKLNEKFSSHFLIGLGNDKLLNEIGLKNIKTFDWHQSVILQNIKFTFTPCQHWSGRGLFDRRKTLWGAWVIDAPSMKSYFAGDTGYGEFFKETGKRYGPFDLAMIPIGAYEPRWFMKKQHVNPEEAVQAHIDLKSNFSIGMHFGTFQLTDEAINQPKIDLNFAKDKMNIDDKQFLAPDFGETFIIKRKLSNKTF